MRRWCHSDSHSQCRRRSSNAVNPSILITAKIEVFSLEGVVSATLRVKRPSRGRSKRQHGPENWRQSSKKASTIVKKEGKNCDSDTIFLSSESDDCLLNCTLAVPVAK